MHARVYNRYVLLVCRLLGAEDAILKAGGIVIRLVGLYHAGRWVAVEDMLSQLARTKFKGQQPCDYSL